MNGRRVRWWHVGLQITGMVTVLSAADCQSPELSSGLNPGAPGPGAASQETTVLAAALPPEPQFVSRCTGIACSFDASAATDPASVLRWLWDFGDGTSVERTGPTAKKLYQRPGIFQVTLTVTDMFGGQASFTKPDTITAEPVGMTKIAENSFDCVRDCDVNWYYQEGYQGAAVAMQDSGAPRSPPGIVQQNFTPQLEGGSSPASIGTNLVTQKQTLYTAIWMRMSENYVGHPSNVNKVIHFYTKGGRNIAIFMVRGAGNGVLIPAFNMQGLAAPYRWTSGGRDIFETEANLDPNLAVCVVTRGRWHRYEMVLTNNTPGIPDGRVEMWMDGTKCLDYRGLTYVGLGQNNKWEQVNWSPTWGGGPTSVLSPFFTQVDHIYISGK